MSLFQLRHGIVYRICLPVASRSPVMIHKQIPRHAGQPSWQSSEYRLVARERAVDSEKNRRAQVFGFRRVAGESVAQIEHAPGVAAHKFLPGRPFAPETLLHQLGVGLQSSSASNHPTFLSASHNETHFGPKKFPCVCGSERSATLLSLFHLLLSGILSALSL